MYLFNDFNQFHSMQAHNIHITLRITTWTSDVAQYTGTTVMESIA